MKIVDLNEKVQQRTKIKIRHYEKNGVNSF